MIRRESVMMTGETTPVSGQKAPRSHRRGMGTTPPRAKSAAGLLLPVMAAAMLGFAQNAAAQVTDYSIEDVTVTEGQVMTFTIRLDSIAPGEIGNVADVELEFSDDTATMGTDYTLPSVTTYSFTGNSVGETQTFTVQTTDDSMDEGASESFTVSLMQVGALPGDEITFDTATGTITDNDDPPTPVVTIGDASATEGSAITFTITLSAAVTGGLTVTPSYTNVSTTAADYTANTDGVDFTGDAGETQTFTVATTDDDIDETDETFTVGLAVSGTSTTVTATDTATGTITDNDTAAVTIEDAEAEEGDAITFTVTLSAGVPGGLTVTPSYTNVSATRADYTANTAALAFTGTAGETQTFTVATTDDDIDEGDETFTVGLAVSGTSLTVTSTVTATGTITDNDTAAVTIADASADEGGVMTFTVTLSHGVPGGLTVTPSYTNVSTTAADYTANTDGVDFTGTAGETQTFTVATTEDDIDEPDETFTVGLMVSGTAITVNMDDTATGTIRDPVDAEPFTDINRLILPEIARAIADQTAGAISQRIHQAGSGRSPDAAGANLRPAARFTLGGQSTLADVVAVHGRALADGALDLPALLGNSGFVLPLNDTATGLSRLTIWGGGQYRNLAGAGSAVDWDGDLLTGQIGADAHLGRDLLVGVALSRNHSSVDYTQTLDTTFVGEQTLTLTGVHPYLGWTSRSGRVDLWGTAGYGWGDLEITGRDTAPGGGAARPTVTTDASLYTVGVGGSGQLIRRGASTVRLKADLAHTKLAINGRGEQLTELDVEARRARVGLEAAHIHALQNGGIVRPSLEAGVRHDAGDGRTGAGAELGGSLRYTHPAHGLTVEGQGRVLVGHGGGYEDWGIGGIIKLAPGADGRGFTMSLTPVWGRTGNRAQSLWTTATTPGANTGVTPSQVPSSGQVDMLLGYGVTDVGANALLTPYARLTLGDGTTRAYRLGSRLRLREWLTLNLEGARQETVANPVEHGVLLKLGLGW